MSRAMFTAISGLTANSTKMDVISNNIANASTTGFKKNTINFSDLVRQTISTSSSPAEGKGGKNGVSVGLGVKVDSQNTLFTQGNFVATGRGTDLAIEGDSFFVVSDGAGKIYYTRNGNFSLDCEGNLVTSQGFLVLGKSNDGSNYLEPIKVPIGETMPPTVTGTITIGNNLSAATEVGGVHNTSIEIFDNLGGAHIIKMQYEKVDDNEWEVTMSLDPGSATIKQWFKDNGINYDTLSASDKATALENANNALLTNRTQSLIFTQFGSIDVAATQAANGSTGDDLFSDFTLTPLGAKEMNISIDATKMTQYNSSTTATALEQDGNPPDVISSIAFDQYGTLRGVFPGGQTAVLGTLSLATFTNNEGLDAAGGTLFSQSYNSGVPIYGTGYDSQNGNITVGYLENSNVDLQTEITQMISTQRMYSVCAKMVTSADEMLQDLINLKR